MRHSIRSFQTAADRPLLARCGVLLVFCVFLLAQQVRAQAHPIISTIAGGGAPASGNGDGGPATNARLQEPVGVAVDGNGNVYVSERYGFTVRKVSTTGTITTVAGNGTQIYNGDGIQATAAAIDVRGIAVDSSGNLFIADGTNRRIRKVAPTGLISTIASSGLDFPSKVAVGLNGAVYVIDGARVKRIAANGSVHPFAGNGEYGSDGDGGLATSASLENPSAIVADRAGGLYIVAQTRVRHVDAQGLIRTVAGGGPFRIDPVAVNNRLIFLTGAVLDSRGNLYISSQNSSVRALNRDGILGDAVARIIDGGGMVVGAPHGFGGDGGPALDAMLYEPEAVATDAQDNLYIADTRNNRVRKVTTMPTLRTPAGIGAFEHRQLYGVGSFTTHVAIGDVNGDGRQDALLRTTGWSYDNADPQRDMRVWWFRQQVDGTLASPVAYRYVPVSEVEGGRSGGGLGIGDLNRDGFADVVVGTLDGVTVFLGNVTGLGSGVRHVSRFRNAAPVLSVTLMDVDRDGKLDVVTLAAGRTEGGTSVGDKVGLVVHHGDGRGGFSTQSFTERPPEVEWAFLRAKDINRDGFPDLTSGWSGFIAGYPTGGVEISLHNLVSGFRPTTRVRPTGSDGRTWGPVYAFGDFNSDGTQDAIVARERNTPDAAYLLFHQTIDGRFQEQSTWKAFDLPAEMLAADMNGDGRDDLVVVHSGWSSIGYHEQNDAGLDVEIKYHTPNSGNVSFPSLAIGDLNGDGCKDVALADYNQGLIVFPGKNCSLLRRSNGSSPLGSRAQSALRYPTPSEPSIQSMQSLAVVPGSTGDTGSNQGAESPPGDSSLVRWVPWPKSRMTWVFVAFVTLAGLVAVLKFRIFR